MADYSHYFKNKKITLMGLGLLGRGVGDARFLAEQGADVTVTDLKTGDELRPSLEQLRDYPNVRYVLAEHREEDFRDADMIIKNADVPLDSPYIQIAREAGVPVEMSTALFARLTPATVVGVTGTRGKSTVTHLLDAILRQAGQTVHLGGNVKGVSTLAMLPETNEGDIALLELDSWQLQGFAPHQSVQGASEAGISPHVAVFTTFFADHMNYYGGDPNDPEAVRAGMERYLNDKAQIFLNQTEDDYLILGPQVASRVNDTYGDRIRSTIVEADPAQVPESWGIQLPGEHNRYNIAVAAAAARVLDVNDEDVRIATEHFSGVPGRLEYLREVRGVHFYNDTTSTTPDATMAGLEALSFEYGKRGRIILIFGGADKNLETRELMNALPEHCKHVVVLPGTGTERIRQQITKLEERGVGVSDASNMDEAVHAAAGVAEEGDLVLLSPAFASFGLFRNEFDRGDQYTRAVKALR